MKKAINIPGAPAAVGPYSQAMLDNGILYVSGQIPINPLTGLMVEGEIEVHTRQVLENVSNILKSVEMDFSNIVKSTIFLADMNDFAKVNEVYSSYFIGNFPARETVQVARLPKDSRVEISVIASL